KSCSIKKFDQCLSAFLEARHSGAELSLALLVHTVEQSLPALQMGQGFEEDVQQRVIVRAAHVNAIQRFELLEIEARGGLVDVLDLEPLDHLFSGHHLVI